MSFLDDLMKEMGGPVAEQLGQREGLNEAQSKGILEGLAPVILGGLKRKKEQGVDLEDLMSGLGAKEEGLDNLGGFFEGAENLDLGAGGVLGLEKGEQAADAIAKEDRNWGRYGAEGFADADSVGDGLSDEEGKAG